MCYERSSYVNSTELTLICVPRGRTGGSFSFGHPYLAATFQTNTIISI